MNEFKHILKLAWPLFFTQIIASLMFFTDTIMASRAGHVDMASVSIATGIWSPIIFTVQGFLIAVTPVVAQLFGADKNKENHPKMVSVIYQGGYIAAALCMVVIILSQFIHIPLDNLELEAELYDKSLGYLNFVVWSVAPTCLFFVLRAFCEGVGETKPALLVSAVALMANVPLNYIFVFGKFGMPELGGAGCGLATAIVQWVSCITLIIYFKFAPKLKAFNIFQNFEWPSVTSMKMLTKIGIPISLSILFETSLFAFMALFIAPLGAIAVAGHQVAFSYSAVLFMLPLSLSMAATIRVGYLRGFGDVEKLKRSINSSFALAFITGVLGMLTTIFFKIEIINIYTDQPEVVALASSILLIAAIYQLPDAIQVMAAGVFKGLKITQPLLYITFISYWPVGFVLGYILGRTDLIVPNMGPQGFWLGTTVGLITASLLFIYKLRKIIPTL